MERSRGEMERARGEMERARGEMERWRGETERGRGEMERPLSTARSPLEERRSGEREPRAGDMLTSSSRAAWRSWLARIGEREADPRRRSPAGLGERGRRPRGLGLGLRPRGLGERRRRGGEGERRRRGGERPRRGDLERRREPPASYLQDALGVFFANYGTRQDKDSEELR